MRDHALHHLTADQLAARWCVSAGHLANLRCEGRGPAYLKLGARVAYRLADVEEYEAARVILPTQGFRKSEPQRAVLQTEEIQPA